MDSCSILLPNFDIYIQGDLHGCLNKRAHFDGHISILLDGRIIQWEYEFCPGCTVCNPEEAECFTHKEITKDEATQILMEAYKGILPEDVSNILNRLV